MLVYHMDRWNLCYFKFLLASAITLSVNGQQNVDKALSSFKLVHPGDTALEAPSTALQAPFTKMLGNYELGQTLLGRVTSLP